MKIKLYGERLANALAENALLKVCFVLMLAATVVNAVVAYRAMNNQKVIILPPVVDRKIEIRGSEVNDDYLKLMARYGAKLLLDYDPSNIEENFSDFLKLATPEVFGSMRSQMDKIIEEVQRLRVSSSFHIHTIKRLGSQNRIEIVGERTKRSDNTLVSQDIEHHLIDYEIDEGTFHIKGVTEKDAIKTDH
jgi:conjugal transfer pilus assembly protein TraE